MVGGNGVEDEVEAAGVLLHPGRITRDHDLVRTETERVLLLAGRRREDDDVRLEGTGELDAHVAQAAKADDPDLLAFACTPVAEWRVGRDAGAEQWRSASGVEHRRDVQHEMLVDDDALGVAAVGDAAEMRVWGAVGERRGRAELLEA